MLKTLVTLVRGSQAAAADQLADQHALLLLDQQVRDAANTLSHAQSALAVALAGDAQAARRCAGAQERTAGLKQRARAALAAGGETLAMEAAEAIATLEAEHAASQKARTLFAAEIARLRGHVADTERRLAELDRGRRLARVAEAVRISRRGTIEPAGAQLCTLSEAEATLARLRGRQESAADACDALEGVSRAAKPETIEDRLEAAGFGPATRPTAASVLARLKLPQPKRTALCLTARSPAQVL